MKAELLLHDPVFHLNLLLWMSKDQPLDAFRVRPLFHQFGFTIVYIEQPFPLPEEIARKCKNSTLSIKLQPEPEIILGRDRDKKALYFEAKKDSFSPASTTAEQARGHLLATGPSFADVMKPLSSCLLCYVLPATKVDAMAECLGALGGELRNEGLMPGDSSVHGLSLVDCDLHYSWDRQFGEYLGIDENEATVLSGIDEETDPTPLILVLNEEDCPDPENRDFYRQVVIEKVRAYLLCRLHAHPMGESYVVSADDLLLHTSNGLYRYCAASRQKRLQRLIRENILRRIYDYWHEKLQGISFGHGLLQVKWSGNLEKETFLNWLEDRRTAISSAIPALSEEPQHDMFDDIDKMHEGT